MSSSSTVRLSSYSDDSDDFEVETLQRALAGDNQAQYEIGLAYYNNQATRDNFRKASKWLLSSANSGNMMAQYLIGRMYMNGRGVEQNNEKAIDWLKKSAINGNIDSQYLLGVIYYDGLNTEKNYEEAASWFYMAAEQGHSGAQFHLGHLHSHGLGVVQDFRKSFEWYTQAAKQGDMHAIEKLNIILQKLPVRPRSRSSRSSTESDHQGIVDQLVRNKQELEEKTNRLEFYKQKCEQQGNEIMKLKQEAEKNKKKNETMLQLMQMLQSNGIFEENTTPSYPPNDSLTNSPLYDDDPANDIYYDDPKEGLDSR